MINDESRAAVGAEPFGQHFIHPRYDAYGFAQLPQTLRALLTGDTQQGIAFGPHADLYNRYDAVILLFADAFGWRFGSNGYSIRCCAVSPTRGL